MTDQRDPADKERPPQGAVEEVLRRVAEAEPHKAARSEDDPRDGEAGDAVSPNVGAQEQAGHG